MNAAARLSLNKATNEIKIMSGKFMSVSGFLFQTDALVLAVTKKRAKGLIKILINER
jgi:hypothetical protein